MKQIFLIVFFISSLSLLLIFPLTALAQDGLLPCGPGTGQSGDPGFDDNLGYVPCRVCHLFVLIDNILGFVILGVMPPIVLLMLIVGGIWFYFSGASEERKRKAKDIITSVVIGVAIFLSAWIIVNAILIESGLVDSASWAPWHEIECTF